MFVFLYSLYLQLTVFCRTLNFPSIAPLNFSFFISVYSVLCISIFMTHHILFSRLFSSLVPLYLVIYYFFLIISLLLYLLHISVSMTLVCWYLLYFHSLPSFLYVFYSTFIDIYDITRCNIQLLHVLNFLIINIFIRLSFQ